MSKTKNKKKDQKRKEEKEVLTNTELLEGSEGLNEQIQKTETFIKNNRYILGGVLGAVVLVVGIFLYLNFVSRNQEVEAQDKMYPAVYFLAADSLGKAIDGDDEYPGFKEIYKDFPQSSAANLAHFYAGVAFLKQGEYKAAIKELKDFSASDYFVQARTYSLIGDAYMEQKNYSEAADYYKRAADYKPNEFFTPAYLMKLALAYELGKENDKAVATYDRVIEEYFKSADVTNAKKYKAKLLVGESK